jgi:hypothetical protein
MVSGIIKYLRDRADCRYSDPAAAIAPKQTMAKIGLNRDAKNSDELPNALLTHSAAE